MQENEIEKVVIVQKVAILHPNDKRKFLILKRQVEDTSRPGDFDIPGGRARLDERQRDALLREVMEETGLDIEDIKPIIVNSRIQKEEKIYFLYIGYSAIALSEDVKINSSEHYSFEWTNIETFILENPEHILTEQIKRIQ